MEDGYDVVNDSRSSTATLASAPAYSDPTASLPSLNSIPGTFPFQSQQQATPQQSNNANANPDIHSLAQASLANALAILNSLSNQATNQANNFRDQAQAQTSQFLAEQLNRAEQVANQHGPQVAAGVQEALRRVDSAVQSANHLGSGQVRGLDGILGGVQQILNTLIGGGNGNGGISQPQSTTSQQAPTASQSQAASSGSSTTATSTTVPLTAETATYEEARPEPMSDFDRMMARNRSQGMALGQAFGDITARRAARLNPNRQNEEWEAKAEERIQTLSSPSLNNPTSNPVHSSSSPPSSTTTQIPIQISESVQRTNQMLNDSWMQRLQQMGHQSQPKPYGTRRGYGSGNQQNVDPTTTSSSSQSQASNSNDIANQTAEAVAAVADEPSSQPQSVEETNKTLENAFEEMLAKMRGGNNQKMASPSQPPENAPPPAQSSQDVKQMNQTLGNAFEEMLARARGGNGSQGKDF